MSIIFLSLKHFLIQHFFSTLLTFFFFKFNSYEYDNNDLRRQRNAAVDERDSVIRMVERRDSELQRLREDIKTLSTELSAAINAKCEALANAEEVESKRLALDFR